MVECVLHGSKRKTLTRQLGFQSKNVAGVEQVMQTADSIYSKELE